MLTLMIDQPPPYTIVIATGDCDLSYALAILRSRRYKVILVHPPSVHESLLMQADHTMSWYSQVLGINEENNSSSSSSTSTSSSSSTSPSHSSPSSDGFYQTGSRQATPSARPQAHKSKRPKSPSAYVAPSPRIIPQDPLKAGYQLQKSDHGRPMWDVQEGRDEVNSTISLVSPLQSPRNPRSSLPKPGPGKQKGAPLESIKPDPHPLYHLPPAEGMFDPPPSASNLPRGGKKTERQTSRSSGSFSIVSHPSPKATHDVLLPLHPVEEPTPSTSSPKAASTSRPSQGTIATEPVIPSSVPLSTSQITLPGLPMSENTPTVVPNQAVTSTITSLPAVPPVAAVAPSPNSHSAPATATAPTASQAVVPLSVAPTTPTPPVSNPVIPTVPLPVATGGVSVSTPVSALVPTTSRSKSTPVTSASVQGSSSKPATLPTSQPSTKLSPPPTVPEQFRVLVRLLQQYRLKGELWPSQGVIATKILRDNPKFYQSVQASKWREYATKAVNAGIVTREGEWISLNEKWLNAVVP